MRLPRVALSESGQPWAEWFNPFGIGERLELILFILIIFMNVCIGVPIYVWYYPIVWRSRAGSLKVCSGQWKKERGLDRGSGVLACESLRRLAQPKYWTELDYTERHT
jgi:hypothetical protein